MNDRAKGFGQHVRVGPLAGELSRGAERVKAEDAAVRQMLDRAVPPAAVPDAPIAPAQGPRAVVSSFAVTRGGIRRAEGAHLRVMSPLEIMVAQAWQRHKARGGEAAFVPPFTPGQIAMANDYAALVEWRGGSGVRCASLEAGRGGSGSGVFIDRFIDQGAWLAELRARCGDGVAMSPRRHMDRGNARRVITVRSAVDDLALGGLAVKAILRGAGWVGNMRECGELRRAICAALDRMQGYRGECSTR